MNSDQDWGINSDNSTRCSQYPVLRSRQRGCQFCGARRRPRVRRRSAFQCREKSACRINGHTADEAMPGVDDRRAELAAAWRRLGARATRFQKTRKSGFIRGEW